MKVEIEKHVLSMIQEGKLGSCYVCGTITTTRCINPGHGGKWICKDHTSNIAGVCWYCNSLGYEPPAEKESTG